LNNAAPPNKQLYYEQVWALVHQIPRGKVATYGQISKMLPQPDEVSTEDYMTYASRWVGLAMSACPNDVPWHRVVNSQGKISHPEAYRQIALLQREAVYFSNDRLNLKQYLWHTSENKAEPAQGQLF